MRAMGVLALSWVVTVPALGGPGAVVFEVGLDASVRATPISGRVVVQVIRDGAKLRPGTLPADGPFWDDPQPLFGTDATITPGGSVKLDDSATGFPIAPSDLEPGWYTAQARLELPRTTSSWRERAGNMYSEPVRFERVAGEAASVRFVLTGVTTTPLPEPDPRVDVVVFESKLLRGADGSPVRLRAGVVKPVDFDPTRKYPAVYEVPGFGGDHLGAFGVVRMRDRAEGGSAADTLARSAYWIVLDPESPNGHTLFADSANNGPRGRALTEELIPELERRHNLISEASARVLRGHSSGGWSVVWLALQYPDVFGAAWSSAPDPVDFRAFQSVDVYTEPNMYIDAEGKERTSYRRGGRSLMTIRQENGGEEVLGPDNTSAQQWDSWQAVFGPRNAAGNPAALYDPETGAIDRNVAEAYRAYDIGALVRGEPMKYGSLLRDRVRLYVGDQDNFFLEGAVKLLSADLDRVYPSDALPRPAWGFMLVLPGYDHGTIFRSPELGAIPGEMMEFFRRGGHAPATPQGADR